MSAKNTDWEFQPLRIIKSSFFSPTKPYHSTTEFNLFLCLCFHIILECCSLVSVANICKIRLFLFDMKHRLQTTSVPLLKCLQLASDKHQLGAGRLHWQATQYKVIYDNRVLAFNTALKINHIQPYRGSISTLFHSLPRGTETQSPSWSTY